MAFAKTFTELQVWQEAHKLVLMIYKVTEDFPTKERFGLTSQLCRAAVSITSNITEGFERGSKKEFAQFLIIARGSIGETQNQLLLAKDLKYLLQNDYDKINVQSVKTHKLLNAFLRSLRTTSLLADNRTTHSKTGGF